MIINFQVFKFKVVCFYAVLKSLLKVTLLNKNS